jgi:hypothetical protein
MDISLILSQSVIFSLMAHGAIRYTAATFFTFTLSVTFIYAG